MKSCHQNAVAMMGIMNATNTEVKVVTMGEVVINSASEVHGTISTRFSPHTRCLGHAGRSALLVVSHH